MTNAAAVPPSADQKYCSECGKIILRRAEICPGCGCRQLPAPIPQKGPGPVSSLFSELGTLLRGSYRLQDAAQKAEEQDLKNVGYDPKFILRMRIVKGKLLHVRATALCTALLVFTTFISAADQDNETLAKVCLALTIALVLAGVIFRNYPRHTRFETGCSSPLSGRELYEEQLRYLKQGISTAAVCTAGAVAIILTAFLVFKEEIEASQRVISLDPLMDPLHNPTTLENIAITSIVIGIGLLVASGMRWFNLVSCQVRLQRDAHRRRAE